VGAVVVLATVIAVVGTMWFQRFQLAEKRYHVFVRFDEVGGLVSGDPVYVNGVERGRVESVSLLADRVVVDLGVRDGVVIPDDSDIALKSIGIMGERFVAIRQGTTPRAIQPGDTLNGEFLMGMSEVMGAAGGILDEVQVTSRHLREIAEALSRNGKLEEGVEDFAAASKSLRRTAESNRMKLDRSLAHVERTTALLDSLVGGNFPQIDSTLASIGRAGGDAETAAKNLAVVSSDLKDITARLRAGEGSAGRLLTDDQLIRRLESTLAQLDSLLEDMRKHPGRYVKFSLF
jgi:phospholipid/cholesterol/gamma-HCH transport system substrate-binding protein